MELPAEPDVPDASTNMIAATGQADPMRSQPDYPAGVLSASYGKLLLDDLVYVIRSPSQWSDEDWRNAGIAAAGVIAVGSILDRKAYERSVKLREREHEQRAKNFERLGTNGAVLAVLGGFYVAGSMGNTESMYVAQDGLASSLIASAVITPALKLIVGRRRPSENEGSLHLKPFSDKNSSFPSGHTTQAFVLASTIASHYDQPWGKGLAYGLATMTGAARVYHGAHFASDVAVGALIGAYVGSTVAAYNTARRTNTGSRLSIMPTIAPRAFGIVMQMQF
jgi:membrane-associated phospholipid phosphatase